METYFTIKLWTEFYIPLITIATGAAFILIAIAVANFANFCERKFFKSKKDIDWSDKK